ncbi:DJ-1/PfpI family protein [candidate division WOR-3 bacterium]|nr:DJ-1/PfpI family protein [candidate division WOR-3 bacterium]
MKVLTIIAEGFEEIEAVSVVDLLRRADIETITAGIKKLLITGSHGISIQTDSIFEHDSSLSYEALVIPGGLKAVNVLASSDAVLKTIRKFNSENKLICAVCAAPLVLDTAGILEGKTFTCHPSVKEKIKSGNFIKSRVVTHGNIITSQGPGTIFDFALSIIENIKDAKTAGIVSSGALIS